MHVTFVTLTRTQAATSHASHTAPVWWCQPVRRRVCRHRARRVASRKMEELDVLGKSSFGLGRLRLGLACALGSRQMPPSKRSRAAARRRSAKAASSSAAAGTSAELITVDSGPRREEPLFRPQAQAAKPKAQEHKGCVQACVLARAPRQGVRSTRCRGFCQIRKRRTCSR